MPAKSGMHYRTKNRDALVSYLQTREGEHVTVNEIHDHFRSTGSTMGVATIYRQLEQLVADGQMRKYTVDSGSAACFEYVGDQPTDAPFVHCKCERCGRLLHIRCGQFEDMQKHISGEHDFTVDPRRTVLYGLCADCK